MLFADGWKMAIFLTIGGNEVYLSIFISAAVPFISFLSPPPEFPLGKYLPLFSGLTLTRVSRADFIKQDFQQCVH